MVTDLFRSSLILSLANFPVRYLKFFCLLYIKALWATLLANTLTIKRAIITITMSGFLLIFFSGADSTYMLVNGSSFESFNFSLKKQPFTGILCEFT